MACNTDMLSENITKLFLLETFTNVMAVLIASTSAEKKKDKVKSTVTGSES